MKIERSLFPILKKDLSTTDKVVILYGARQTGKDMFFITKLA